MSNEQNRQYKKSVKFDGKNYWIFIAPLEKKAYLWDKYLLPDLPEKIFHPFGSIGHMSNERVNECKSAYFKSTPEWAFYHPDKNGKTESEDEMKYQGKDTE